MEPGMIETPVESRGEGPAVPPRPPERKRRFQIVKLEERIAPGQVGNDSISPRPDSHPCRRCASGGASIV
jgi:hypothetical protein